jgi:hypothetical protein
MECFIKNIVGIAIGLFSFFLFSLAQASSCCGQTGARFQILEYNEGLSLEVTQTWLNTLGHVFSEVNSFESFDRETRRIQSTGFQVIYRINEDWQSFLVNRYFINSYGIEGFQQKFSGWGDTQWGFNFHWSAYLRKQGKRLPEEQDLFSSWFPEIFLSPILNLPSGQNFFTEKNFLEAIHVTGYGQWGYGLGLTLIQDISFWQGRLQIKGLQLLERSFGVQKKVSDFYETAISGSVRYRFSSFVAEVGWLTEMVSGRYFNEFPTERVSVSTAQISLSKPLSLGTQVTVTFLDQSLLGPAQNTYINEGVSVSWIQSF